MQSLILTAILLMLGFMVFMLGVMGDLISKNRKLLEDIQYRTRKMEVERCKPAFLAEDEEVKEEA